MLSGEAAKRQSFLNSSTSELSSLDCGIIIIGAEADVSLENRYGRDQSCALALAVASANSFVSTPVSQIPLSSSSAFALSRLAQGSSSLNADDTLDDGLLAVAKQVYDQYGQTPAVFPSSAFLPHSSTSLLRCSPSSVCPSPNH